MGPFENLDASVRGPLTSSTPSDATTRPRSHFITYAIISSVLSSVATLFKVQGVHHLPPLLAASVGVLFAGALTFVVLVVTRKVPTWVSLKQVGKPLLQLSFCRSFFSNIIFTTGLLHTTGVEAVFLTKMEPYLVIFWAWILDKHRPSGNHLALLVVHVAGAILLSAGSSTQAHGVSWFGDLLVVCAVVTAALSYRFAPKVTKVLNPLQTACVSETIGGLASLPIALALCPIELGPQQIEGWLFIAAHSILFYIFSIALLYASLNGIEGWLSSALRATGPVLATPIALIFFGETLTPVQLFGAATVLVTSALISKDKKK